MLLAHGPFLLCPLELAVVLVALPSITYLIQSFREYGCKTFGRIFASRHA